MARQSRDLFTLTYIIKGLIMKGDAFSHSHLCCLLGNSCHDQQSSIAMAWVQLMQRQDAGVDIPLVSPADIQEIRHITSYPTKDEIMDVFNAYVRGPLRDTVLKSTGKEEYVSFTLCSVASLPFFLMGLALTFLCDGHRDCQKSASVWGYPSLVSYMLGSSVSNLLVTPLFNSAICPLMLRATCLIKRAVPDEESIFLRMFWGSLLCAGLLFLWESLLIVECAMVLVAFAKSSWLCFAGSTAGILLPLWVHWIFRENHQRCSWQTGRQLWCRPQG